MASADTPPRPSSAATFGDITACSVAATNPPVGRMMLLNRIGEILKLDGSTELLELSVNQFRGNIHPRGDQFLRKFELGETAKWHFRSRRREGRSKKCRSRGNRMSPPFDTPSIRENIRSN